MAREILWMVKNNNWTLYETLKQNRLYYINALSENPNVPRKIIIDLLYFCQVYDFDLWEKNIGRIKAYSGRANGLYSFIILKKKTMNTDED